MIYFSKSQKEIISGLYGNNFSIFLSHGYTTNKPLILFQKKILFFYLQDMLAKNMYTNI